MARPVAPGRDGFALFRPLQTRWADNDIYGHMNNVVHYALFDSAVNGWLVEVGLLSLTDGPVFLVVDTACAYFSELAFPDRIEAGIAVDHLGTSSVRYAIALFREGEATAAAAGRFTHVRVDRDTRRPVPLDPPARAALQALVRG